MRILECSSKGDKRFSAFYAKVKVFGLEDSIERHYQNCKRDENGCHVNKGESVKYIVINGKKISAIFLTAYYKLLWCSYLDHNEHLVEYAKSFDDYNDMFKGKAVNCQADVIRQYVKEGRQSILNEPNVIELRCILGI